MPGQVADEVKAERLARLQALLEEQLQAFNDAQVGKTLPVLFEKPGREAGQLMGRTPYLQPVHVHGPRHLIGQVQDAKVGALTANSLHGALAETIPFESVPA